MKTCPQCLEAIAYLCASAQIIAAAFLAFLSLMLAWFFGILLFGFAIAVGVPGIYLFVSLCTSPRINFTLRVIQTAASILVKVPAAAVLSYIILGIQALWITFWLLVLRRSLEAPAYVIGFFFFRSVTETTTTTTIQLHQG